MSLTAKKPPEKPPTEDIDFLSDENEIKEMENWLKTQEGLDYEVTF